MMSIEFIKLFARIKNDELEHSRDVNLMRGRRVRETQRCGWSWMLHVSGRDRRIGEVAMTLCAGEKVCCCRSPGTQCENVTIMLCKKLCDDCNEISSSEGTFANHMYRISRRWWWFIERSEAGDRARDAIREKLPHFLRTNGIPALIPSLGRTNSIPLAVFTENFFANEIANFGPHCQGSSHSDVPDVISLHFASPFNILTWLKASAPEFQFFTNSNGKVGMNGELLVLGDGTKPGAKKLESLIGTVTVGREEKRKSF